MPVPDWFDWEFTTTYYGHVDYSEKATDQTVLHYSNRRGRFVVTVPGHPEVTPGTRIEITKYTGPGRGYNVILKIQTADGEVIKEADLETVFN